MKTAIALVCLVALTSLAQAQDKKKTPDSNTSPWSVDTVTKSDGYFGTTSTTLKRDIGDGWSVGGKMTTPYEDQKIGGSGAPGLKQYESGSSTTLFGPVLEKKF